MKKIIFYITFVLFFGVTSCDEDFTNNPPENIQDLEGFFLSEKNVEEAVIGIYDLMQFNYNRDWHSAFLVKLLPGDEAGKGGENQEDQVQLDHIDKYAPLDSSNSSTESVWNLFYRTIAMSNLVIDNLKESTLSNKDRAIAEAKFFRAWCFFELTTMFGDIPLRIEVPKAASDFALKKSPRAEIYQQIEEDLKEVIGNLPEKSAVPDVFRVSKGAAQALMGKVLVFQEKYGEAIPFFESVINNPSHDLEANIEDVWSADSEFGKESLLEIGYVTTSGRTWNDGSIAWGGRNESNLHIQLMGPRGEFFDLPKTGVDGWIGGWGMNLPTSKLVKAFEAAGDDKRKNATLLTESDFIALGGSIIVPKESIWDYDGALRVKYTTRSQETSKDGVQALNYGTNFRLFRYAEVLLLAAEAYNKSGNDSKAMIELNKIRARAGLADVTGLAGNTLFEAIVNEKFLELAHEGQRFWDLVRWGKTSTELVGTEYTSKNDLFPIPASEIDKNTALTEADQNPGY